MLLGTLRANASLTELQLGSAAICTERLSSYLSAA